MDQQPTVTPKAPAAAAPGATLLKISGILMIIFGAIGIVTNFIVKAATMIGQALAASDAAIADGFSKLSTGFTFSLLGAVLTLVAGIIAVVVAKKPGKAMPAIIFSALVIVMTIISQVMMVGGVNALKAASESVEGFTYAGSTFGFSNILSILSSIVLPVLAIIGGLKNNKIIKN